MAEFLEQASHESKWLMAYAVGGVVLLIALFGFQDGKPRWQTLVMYAVFFPIHTVVAVGIGLLFALWTGGSYVFEKYTGTIFWSVFAIVLGIRAYLDEPDLFDREGPQIAERLVVQVAAQWLPAAFITFIVVVIFGTVFGGAGKKQ